MLAMDRFLNRSDAGRRLAAQLETWATAPGREGWSKSDPLVLGLARGGVPVAYEVARALGAPLGAMVVRKLGVPGLPELAMGAVGPGGARVINEDVVRGLRIPEGTIEELTRRAAAEIERKEREYRRASPASVAAGGGGSLGDVRGRTVIVVDDGLATGATMRAAIAALRRAGAATVVVAAPTGSAETCEDLRSQAEDVVCLMKPARFSAVGIWYEDFTPTTDEEVCGLLARASTARQRSGAAQGARGARHA
jgi:putative phosphoribosyl transferase